MAISFAFLIVKSTKSFLPSNSGYIIRYVNGYINVTFPYIRLYQRFLFYTELFAERGQS